jgi:signal transduction histidine kinase
VRIRLAAVLCASPMTNPAPLSMSWRERALECDSLDDCVALVLHELERVAEGHVWLLAPRTFGTRCVSQPPASWDELIVSLGCPQGDGGCDVRSLGAEQVAVLVMPVKLHAGASTCSFAIARSADRPFDDAECAAIGELVRQAGPVIDRAMLMFEVQFEKRVREMLAQVNVVLDTKLDFQATLDQIVRRALVDDIAELAAIDLVDGSGSFRRVAIACRDPRKHELAQRTTERRYAPSAQVAWGVAGVIAAGKPQLVAHVTEEIVRAAARDEVQLEVALGLAIRSYLSVPLAIGERTIGALSLASFTRSYDARDLEVGIELARSAALAIENARLYSLERRTARKLRKLQEATVGLAAARTPDDIATVTTRAGAEALGATGAAMWMRTPDGALRLAGSHGIPEAYLEPFRLISADSSLPAMHVMTTRSPLWIESPEQYERLSPELYARAREADRVRSFTTMPVIADDQVAGIVTFSCDGPHVFTADEREYVGALVDATGHAIERAQLFVSAAEAHQRAESASRAKDEFLAMLGHELRNPLAPIVTALDLMKLGSGGKLSREATVIERHVLHLGRLVDDLLDIARITRGDVALRREPVLVGEAIKQALEAVDKMIEDARHKLDVSVDGEVMVDADPARIVQVLTNLLSNAAKYTPGGGRIALSVRADGDDCVISVRDNGKGISSSLLPKVFDLFVQGQRSTHRGEGGLGLGLTIVSSLVRLHGGTVSAQSDGEGRGSEFVVRWPRARPQVATVAAPLPTACGRRVLVVDDNVDAAELLGEMLRHMGHEVTLAHDGAAALQAVAAVRPQIAILDIGLPVMDGYELAARLRADPEARQMRLVALTGYGRSSDAEKAKVAGFDYHFVKPLNLSQLVALLARPGQA